MKSKSLIHKMLLSSYRGWKGKVYYSNSPFIYSIVQGNKYYPSDALLVETIILYAKGKKPLGSVPSLHSTQQNIN